LEDNINPKCFLQDGIRFDIAKAVCWFWTWSLIGSIHLVHIFKKKLRQTICWT